MKRLHLHVGVDDIARAVGFYSELFKTRPCCGGATYANWRVDDPPVNFAARTGHRPRGLAHLGLETDMPADLAPIDRALHGDARAPAAVPWEVSVRKHAVQKEPAS